MKRMQTQRVIMIGSLVVLALAAPAAADVLNVLIILPPRHSMAMEFLPMVDAFEEAGVNVDVAAYETGLYLFTEDSKFGGDNDDDPDRYPYEVTLTYDDIRLSNYDALILGPGHAHTMWVGEGLDRVEELVAEAVSTQRVIGGISFGAVFLVSSGLIDGRTVCGPPHYRGIVDLIAHVELFLSTIDVVYSEGCVAVDDTQEPVVVTGGYRCVGAFVSTFVEIAEAVFDEL